MSEGAPFSNLRTDRSAQITLRHAQTASEMRKPTVLFPMTEQYDLLLAIQQRSYIRSILDILRTCGSLELADNDLSLSILRRNAADFRRDSRLHPERYVVEVLVERIRYCSEQSFELEGSATNCEYGTETDFDGNDAIRLTDLKITCTVHIDRFLSAPFLSVHSLYLLLQLAEYTLRQRTAGPEPAGQPPSGKAWRNDRGDERDLKELSDRFFAHFSRMK